MYKLPKDMDHIKSLKHTLYNVIESSTHYKNFKVNPSTVAQIVSSDD